MKPMRTHATTLGLLAPLALLAGAQVEPQGEGVPARSSPRAYHLEIRGPLDRSTQSHLRRALEDAERDGARLILDIDTPGGPVDLMWQMARAIQTASDRGVHTTAWVNEHAISAGSLVAMSCDLLYMRRTATIGSALPVTIGVTGLQPISEDEQVKEKGLSVYREEFKVVAEKSGRPTLFAEAMVDPSIGIVALELDGVKTYVSQQTYDDLRNRGEQPRFLETVLAEDKLLNVGGVEALEYGISDGLADSLEELARKISVDPASLVTVQRTRSEELASVLYAWSPLLLILAFVLAYVEMKVPGFGIAGILSIVCFAVLLLGRYLVGLADVPHIILITVGIGLIAAEVFLAPGTIWLAALGTVALLAGVIWSFAGLGTGFEYALDREILLDESLRVMVSAALALFATWTLSRFLPRTPFFNRLVLDLGDEGAEGAAMPEAGGSHARLARVGAGGRALTALRPVGKVVLVEDESMDFEARSSGPEIASGASVVVVEVTASGRLVVEEASAT
jgi:membrane-bound serine protease (ClpP class)